MADLTVQDLMNRMPAVFDPQKANGTNAVIQYHLTGQEGGDWVINIHDGQCTVNQSTVQNPNLTLTADAQDYKDVILGKTNAMNAFMQGKLKLAGDLGLAMKLTSFFRMS